MWKRILSALILAPLFLVALFKLPATGIAVLIGSVMVLALWEASALVGFSKAMQKWTYVWLVFLTGFGVFLFVSSAREGALWIFILSGVATVWWAAQIFQLTTFSIDRQGWYGAVTGRVLNTCAVLLFSWMAVLSIYMHDPRHPLLLVYLLVMIWVADSGAYFAGKFLGSRKLAVNVSPGKTIEGVAGAILAVIVYSSVFSIFALGISGWHLLVWVLIAVLVTLVSVAGDLNESALKRVAGKKDSGNIIPGHGGIFDRVDAITAAAPVFYFLWQAYQRGIA